MLITLSANSCNFFALTANSVKYVLYLEQIVADTVYTSV